MVWRGKNVAPHVDEEHENERARAERVGVTAHVRPR